MTDITFRCTPRRRPRRRGAGCTLPGHGLVCKRWLTATQRWLAGRQCGLHDILSAPRHLPPGSFGRPLPTHSLALQQLHPRALPHAVLAPWGSTAHAVSALYTCVLFGRGSPRIRAAVTTVSRISPWATVCIWPWPSSPHWRSHWRPRRPARRHIHRHTAPVSVCSIHSGREPLEHTQIHVPVTPSQPTPDSVWERYGRDTSGAFSDQPGETLQRKTEELDPRQLRVAATRCGLARPVLAMQVGHQPPACAIASQTDRTRFVGSVPAPVAVGPRERVKHLPRQTGAGGAGAVGLVRDDVFGGANEVALHQPNMARVIGSGTFSFVARAPIVPTRTASSGRR